jgi:hypothetical protein
VEVDKVPQSCLSPAPVLPPAMWQNNLRIYTGNVPAFSSKAWVIPSIPVSSEKRVIIHQVTSRQNWAGQAKLETIPKSESCALVPSLLWTFSDAATLTDRSSESQS